MHVESLKVFCDLVETGSFSAAAERNLLTQSAVSQQIRTLEKRYSVKLIDRGSGKKMTATPEGQVLLQAAEQILDVYGAIPEKILKSGDVPRGEVKVATIPNLGLYELEAVRRNFRRTYPAINVRKRYAEWDEAYVLVGDGEVDFALLPYPEKREGFVVETVWHSRLVLVCSPYHRLARYGTVGLRELRGENFVWSAPDKFSGEVMRAMLEKAKVDINVVLEMRYPEAVKHAVKVDGLLAILPEEEVEAEVADQTLKSVEVSSSEMWRPVGIVSSKSKPMGLATSELIRALRDHGGNASPNEVNHLAAFDSHGA